jgi:TrmH family RNA methyltransferase
VKVLSEALASGATIESVYLDPAAGEVEASLAGRCLDAGARVFELDPGVIAKVTDTVTPQPVVAVVRDVAVSLETLLESRPDLVVVCSDLRDPGNAGTVLRSAEAAGAGGVIMCEGSVDAFNPKTVRASAGAVFYVPVVNGVDGVSALRALARLGLHRLGAAARAGVDYLDADLAAPVALVVGNEAHGLAADVAAELDGLITIPMAGRSESLNVGMATAVVCFEAARQRRVGASVARMVRP